MPRYPGYQTYETCGVDIRQFYNDLGTTIAKVSKKAGYARETISGFPVGYVLPETAQKIISVLEEKNNNDYQEIVKEVKQKMEDAWKIYLNREKILCGCRQKYGVDRAHPLLSKDGEKEFDI